MSPPRCPRQTSWSFIMFRGGAFTPTTFCITKIQISGCCSHVVTVRAHWFLLTDLSAKLCLDTRSLPIERASACSQWPSLLLTDTVSLPVKWRWSRLCCPLQHQERWSVRKEGKADKSYAQKPWYYSSDILPSYSNLGTNSSLNCYLTLCVSSKLPPILWKTR